MDLIYPVLVNICQRTRTPDRVRHVAANGEPFEGRQTKTQEIHHTCRLAALNAASRSRTALRSSADNKSVESRPTWTAGQRHRQQFKTRS